MHSGSVTHILETAPAAQNPSPSAHGRSSPFSRAAPRIGFACCIVATCQIGEVSSTHQRSKPVNNGFDLHMAARICRVAALHNNRSDTTLRRGAHTDTRTNEFTIIAPCVATRTIEPGDRSLVNSQSNRLLQFFFLHFFATTLQNLPKSPTT